VPESLTLPRLRGPRGRPLRVAHLTTVDMSLALLLGTELRADVESGLEVYGLSAPGSWVEGVERLGVRHVPVPSLTRSWDLSRDAAAGRELVRALRRLRLDVLHTHNPKTGVLGRLLGRAAGVPVVVNTCHGLWVRPGDSVARKAFVLGAEALAARASHAELYQNAEDRHTLRRAVPARRSRLVGNGVDLARFRPDPQGRARVREELGVRSDELLVGGVGRRVAEKGIREYAATARELAGKARFVWVGPDDPDKPDALRADESGVEFLGERRDMADVYSALDVFVLPSHREGFSRSGMEAAACGVASVLTDIRGCREIGRDERELLLVPPGDVSALTAAVGRLLLDSSLRVRLAAAARERAAEQFDQLAVARVSLQTYAAVARRKGLDWRVC
jgi:glycosyltransferase involved in cell wall biosynthesis